MTSRPPGRKRCCVLFCGRTYKCTADELADPNYEVICGKHYRLADTAIRARRRKVARLMRKAQRLDREGVWRHLARTDNRLWETVKRQANERAAGITAAERPTRKRQIVAPNS